MKRDVAANIKMLMIEAGQQVTVKTGGKSLSIHAFLQPLRYKNKMYIELQPSEVGRVDDGGYLYLGPADVEFKADDIIEAQNRQFVTQRFEKVYLFAKPLYSWAIVRPCVGEEV